jgi:LppX_LprAFG lipoprotein
MVLQAVDRRLTSTNCRGRDRVVLRFKVAGFKVLGLAAVVAMVGCSGDDESEGPPLPAEAATLVDASSTAMGDVTSVRFELERSGAPIYIDEFESLALEKVVGRFAAPGSADAALDVTVDNNLKTTLGAVAIDGTVWLSNPVTGTFEALPPGYDLDPSTFFDPEDGWRPLLAELQEVQLVGEEDRGGKRYHIRGVAPAERMESITAGLVSDQDVPIDLWLRRDTALVTAAEFSTTFDGGVTNWVLELSDYGDTFTIEAPQTND